MLQRSTKLLLQAHRHIIAKQKMYKMTMAEIENYHHNAVQCDASIKTVLEKTNTSKLITLFYHDRENTVFR